MIHFKPVFNGFVFILLSCTTTVLFGQTQGAFNNTNPTGTGGTGNGLQLNTSAGTGGVNTDFGTGLVGRSGSPSELVGTAGRGNQATSGNQQNRRNISSGTQNRNLGQRGDNRATGRVVPFSQRIAFSYQPSAPRLVQSQLQFRTDRLLHRLGALELVRLSLSEEGTVSLNGSVSSLYVSNMIESMVRMEPGVRKVDNQLNVPEIETGTGPLLPTPNR